MVLGDAAIIILLIIALYMGLGLEVTLGDVKQRIVWV